jgi:hypothetical protein
LHRPPFSRVACALLLAAGAGSACAQAIYTCVDAKGRRLTSDRPIADCMDRQQKELNPSGTVRRVLAPSLTAEERAAAEEKAKREQDERAREEEEKRRDKALVARYPDRATHDKERAAALRQVEDSAAAGYKRLGELEAQQKKLAAEAGFYKSDPTRMPAALKRSFEENLARIAAQKRFLGDQEEQKKRINARFDEELERLKKMWAVLPPQPTTARK